MNGDKMRGSLNFDRRRVLALLLSGAVIGDASAAEGKEDTTTVAFTDPVVVGIAMNGHNAGQTTGTARVTDIQITGGGLPTTVEPAGKLTATWGNLKATR